jgi:hypothetical protein
LRNDKKPPRLWLITGSGGNKRSNINIDIESWQKGQWHKIFVSWDREGKKLAMGIDDRKPEIITDANFPFIPAKMLYDIYFSTIFKQSAHANLQHFDGVIDDICIYDEWMTTKKPEKLPEKDEFEIPSDFNKNPSWISRNSERTNIYVEPVSDKWAETPVKLEVELGKEWKNLSSDAKRKAYKSFRLVKYNPQTGKPVVYNKEQKDENKYFHPFQISDDVFYESDAVLRFTHKGAKQAGYSFYYDFEGKYKKSFPLEIPMIGNGDKLRIGFKNTIGQFNPTIAPVFDIADIDGDGDYDFWMNSGTLVTNHCTNLMVGHYFYENISEQTGVRNAFCPGKFIISDNTPTGYISGVVIPNICDINGDGKQDLLMLGRTCQEWWEWEFENGRPVVTEIHELEFTGESLNDEIKVVWYDWDGDGLGDILASKLPNIGKDKVKPIVRVYKNVGSKSKPVIDTENPVELNLNAPELQWRFVPVDWDCDGDIDIISSGFIHELYFYENTAGEGEEPVFAEPARLKSIARREINIPNSLVIIKVIDWDKDGDKDIIWCGEGSVGYIENIAGPDRLPQLRQPVYFNQTKPFMDPGTISVPVVTDWDNDGSKDMILAASNCIRYYENAGTDACPVWQWGENMRAASAEIQLPAGENGSVQGIEEMGWEYNNAWVADWDNDGLKDLISSGTRGEHHLFRNIGRKCSPRLAKGKLIEVDWQGEPKRPEWLPYKPEGDELITVWRTRPVAMDWDDDGLCDYITLDHKGDLVLYKRARNSEGELVLKPGKDIFEIKGPYSQARVWNRPPNAKAGRSGRTVFNLCDWDRDGDYDLIMDNINARYYENVTDNKNPVFVDRGDLVKERVTNHNNGPFVTDWDNDGWLDLFIGTETGRVFYFSRPYIENEAPRVLIAD